MINRLKNILLVLLALCAVTLFYFSLSLGIYGSGNFGGSVFGRVLGGEETLLAGPAQEISFAAAALPYLPSVRRIFVMIVVMFTVLSASINVMQFAGGYSQIRPVNAIPAPVGLVFGQVGALACALGNLLGDLLHFDRYGGTAVLGVIGNFLLAYIPYKVWRAIYGDTVCVHSWRQIGLYVWTGVLSCLSCALILGFGLELITGEWYKEVVSGIFFNNITFTMALGLPVLIVLTSVDFGLGMWVTLQLGKFGRIKMRGPIPNKFAPAICCIDTAVMGTAFVMAQRGSSPNTSPVMKILAVLVVACVVVTCLMEGKEANV